MIEPVAATALQTAQAVRPAVTIGDSGSFGTMISDTAQAMLQSLHAAEQVSAAGLSGQAGVREVAEAVMEAERNLQTAIAIRDKVVSSWVDISRMAI